MNFLSAIPIDALIIITFLVAFNESKSVLFALQIAFFISAFLQLFLSIYVINFWFSNAMKRHLLKPAWFIPIVGNLIVPLAGHSAKINSEFSLLFFAIGCFFWLILTALITSRLIFEESLESKFLPTLFIFIAPPSIFVVDFVALFFMLLMLSLAKAFTRFGFAPHHFTLSWWAFTFPLCAFSIASFEVFVAFGTPLLCYLDFLG
ncbi:SLAC1 family transporter [Helicobacter sp. T3_23-1056]